ncbi:hypothetical protein pah_c207o028 [Parachlamydia acanthamoebae str. Hall's coccus]|nr:hypothetical protein pah_c207o028 [Parachlamydia acanthamoebae str. Hall's coccus]
MSEANSDLSFTERFKFNITVKILFPRLISRTLTTFVETLLGFVGFGTHSPLMLNGILFPSTFEHYQNLRQAQ